MARGLPPAALVTTPGGIRTIPVSRRTDRGDQSSVAAKSAIAFATRSIRGRWQYGRSLLSSGRGAADDAYGDIPIARIKRERRHSALPLPPIGERRTAQGEWPAGTTLVVADWGRVRDLVTAVYGPNRS
jgi:hypothetical protein